VLRVFLVRFVHIIVPTTLSMSNSFASIFQQRRIPVKC
jgi:hypothetical protein